MKKVVIIAVLLFSILINAQGLKPNANHIKDNYPIEYKNTIRKHAIEEWGEDFSMVIYEINKQSEALANIIKTFKGSNTNTVFRAIQEWSIDGYKEKNVKIFKSMNTFDYQSLLKMHCDWSMVKYEYDKQIKAKKSF